MNKPTVFIIGSSGHAKVVIDIFEQSGTYTIAGLLDDYRNTGETTLGYPILGKPSEIARLLEQQPDAAVFIAIGDNWARQKVMANIVSIAPAVSFASAIHPRAQIGKAVAIGKGVAVMAGAVVNSASTLGDFTIINTNACIEHDCTLSAFSSVAPSTTLGGNVFVGTYSAIAIGATITHRVRIGNHAIIGAGALLLKDCPDHTIMYGVPAKPIRTRAAGEPYL